MIQIVEEKIDSQNVLDSVSHESCGANVLFVGTTRKMTGLRETTELNYECYQAMALKTMQELHDEVLEKWPVKLVSIIHRVGKVDVGEASIAVAVSGPHRIETFEAASWLIDTLKKRVPIWKKEAWADGGQEWVHPDEGMVDPTNLSQNETSLRLHTE